jgi:integrase
MTAGSIARRGAHSWRIKYEAGERDVKTGKRATRWVTVNGTKKEAQKELTRLLSAIDSGISVDPSTLTVVEHLRAWLSRAGHLSGKTRERYGDFIEQQIVPHLGSLPLQKLRPAHIADWHDVLLRVGGKNRRPLSARTVGHAHRVLHVALADAARVELLGRNVAGMVHPPKVMPAEIEILKADQLSAMVAKLEGHRLLPIAILVLGTGLRRGEICALRWGDIDLDKARLRVNNAMEQTRQAIRLKEPKTRHGRRTLALPASAVETLRAHRAAQLHQRLLLGLGRSTLDDFVFTLPDGMPWGPNYLSRVWRYAMGALGLPPIGLHSLRHSHASALIAAGIDALTIAKRLGHGSPAFTLAVYGHLFADTDSAAAQAIDDALGARPQT